MTVFNLFIYLLITFLIILQTQVDAFYLPGIAPTRYEEGESIPLLVNALGSPLTALPYDYYFDSFKFCKPENGPKSQSSSLGAILFGDRLYTSPFELNMMKTEVCKPLCDSIYSEKDLDFVASKIRTRYFYSWFVDGLPVAKNENSEIDDEAAYEIGFELGYINTDKEPVLNNLFDITIKYHTDSPGSYAVVGVLVKPFSVSSITDINCDPRTPTGGYPLQSAKPIKIDGKEKKVQFIYNVRFVESKTKWATRWDNYLRTVDVKIHWFSLVNSIVIVFFLSGMVSMILLRALHKDIARYNDFDIKEDANEDFGWKLVHGDVFRPPRYAMLLSVFIGNGLQLLHMTAITLVLALLGLLSPSSRGWFATCLLGFYALFGGLAGFYSTRYYRMMGGERKKRNAVLTAFLLPGVVILMLIFLNFFLIGAESSAAIPFGTIFALNAMWCLVSAPICFVGAFIGSKSPKIQNPVRTNQIPRQIPEQPFYLKTLPSAIMGGILPFGAIFIELYFIMNSLWFSRTYYVPGFICLVFVILLLTCSLVSVLMCYFHLCTENYKWWWRSFLTSGASALYVFMYAVLYFYTRLELADFTSTLLYFGWISVICLLFFIVTGTIGFISCLAFVRKMYGSIRID